MGAYGCTWEPPLRREAGPALGEPGVRAKRVQGYATETGKRAGRNEVPRKEQGVVSKSM